MKKNILYLTAIIFIGIFISGNASAADAPLLEDLMEKACEKIAILTGAEGAFISSGAASGLFISGAACLTGKDSDAIEILPTVKSGKNHFIISK